jgi:uncharacterized protein (DUF433 family)
MRYNNRICKLGFPVMVAQSPEQVDLRKYIEIRLFGERPHIRNRRVPVATIAYSAKSQGWDVARLAYEFTLSEAEVLAALLYYEEHKTEIDAQEAAYQADLDAAYEQHGSKD